VSRKAKPRMTIVSSRPPVTFFIKFDNSELDSDSSDNPITKRLAASYNKIRHKAAY